MSWSRPAVDKASANRSVPDTRAAAHSVVHLNVERNGRSEGEAGRSAEAAASPLIWAKIALPECPGRRDPLDDDGSIGLRGSASPARPPRARRRARDVRRASEPSKPRPSTGRARRSASPRWPENGPADRCSSGTTQRARRARAGRRRLFLLRAGRRRLQRRRRSPLRADGPSAPLGGFAIAGTSLAHSSSPTTRTAAGWAASRCNAAPCSWSRPPQVDTLPTARRAALHDGAIRPLHAQTEAMRRPCRRPAPARDPSTFFTPQRRAGVTDVSASCGPPRLTDRTDGSAPTSAHFLLVSWHCRLTPQSRLSHTAPEAAAVSNLHLLPLPEERRDMPDSGQQR